MNAVTTREKQVAGSIAYGYTDKEIAQNMHISAATVRTHRKRAYEKTGSRNSADITRWYFADRLRINFEQYKPEIVLTLLFAIVLTSTVVVLKPQKINASLASIVKEPGTHHFTLVNGRVNWDYSTTTAKTLKQLVYSFEAVGYLVASPEHTTDLHGGFDNYALRPYVSEFMLPGWNNKEVSGYVSLSLTNNRLTANISELIISECNPVRGPLCTIEKMAVEDNRLTARFKTNEARLLNKALTDLIETIK